jgi:penicillin-binding protein 2
MVSKPSFDPNAFIGGISQQEYARLKDDEGTPLFNRAVAGYAASSTIKPFVSQDSMAYDIRSRDYSVNDPGYFKLEENDHIYHDWTWGVNRSGHGRITMNRAIYQSCNVYFYDLAQDMGIDRMHDFLAGFGFGRNTSIDIPAADSGVLPSRAWKREALGESWYPGETLNSAIGQGYTQATPLQLATAALTMANKGEWKSPVMLKSIGLNGENIRYGNTMPDIELENPEDWNFITQAMEDVVHKGSGGYRHTGTAYPHIAMQKFMPYNMAGTSGTAQVVGKLQTYFDSAEKDE